MVLRVKKKSIIRALVYIQLLLPSLLRGLVVNYGFPISVNVINYITTTALILLILVKGIKNINKSFKLILGGMLVLLMIGVINYIINMTPVTQFYRGTFDYFHVWIIMLIVGMLFRKEDFDYLGNIVVKISYINALIMLIQYFVLGLVQDKLGGIFGNDNGCNGIQNTFYCIGLIVIITDYIYGRKKLKSVIGYCAITAVTAGIAEITIYFFEMVIIVIGAILLVRNKGVSVKGLIRTMGVLVAFVVIAVVGVRVLFYLFPTKVRFLQYSAILDYLGASKGQTGVYDISRIHAISDMKDKFLLNWWSQIFGLGIGYTQIGGTFYLRNAAIPYYWFTSASTVLESGFLGVLFRLGSFVYVFCVASAAKKKNAIDKYAVIAQLTAGFSMILFFYNSTIDNKYDSFLLGAYLATYICCMIDSSNQKTKELGDDLI